MNLPFPHRIPTVTNLNDPQKTPIHRQTLINRIFQLIAIVSNYEERDLLKSLPGVTIPYYIVGVDEDLCNEFRMHFAEMMYSAVFEYPAIDIHPIAGQRISRLSVPSEKIMRWRKDAGRFGWLLNQHERDFVYTWCNMTHVFPAHPSVALWGNHAYVNGIFYERIVDGYFLKNAIGFVNEEMEIVSGEPFPIATEEDVYDFYTKLVLEPHQ